MTMMDLGSVKKDFSQLISQIQPWTLSHFVMWLDIKVAEYKVFGRMIMDNTPNDTPQWLRVSAEYMLEQQKEAMKNAAAAVGDVSISPPVPPVQSPPVAHTTQSVLQKALMNSFEPITSFATSANSLYTVSTVNSTVVSPAISPAFSTVSQARQPMQADAYQKQASVENAELYTKPSPLSQFSAYTGRETGRIPPISHLSPKHIRQSHLEHNMSMSLPVSLTPVSLAKDITGKENLSAAEVEAQIAVLQSQIAAVNKNLQASQAVQEEVPIQLPAPSPHPAPRGRRKAASTDDPAASYVPPPYPKKTRQQSPSSRAASTESALPPLHSSMDIMSRLHRLDTESIPESLRSQNIQSTLEAFEALRTQTFPPNPDVLRTPMPSEMETIQNTAHDMSIHHVTTEREPQVYPVTTEEYTAVTTERDQAYPTAIITAERDQTYQAPGSSVLVKVEQEISDNDSEASQLRTMPVVEEVVTTEDHTGNVAMATVSPDDNQNYAAMYASPANTPANTDEKIAADISTKKMRRKFLESMKNSNPKYYSHQIQQIIPFPDKFPVSNLDYGLKALQMIQTGEITRAGKIQLIDTIFHELIKYTGLYPTPTQKMAVANSIVETFPTLAAKMKASHISPADSWYVILCDKFRNERRGLGGTTSPRVGKTAKVVRDDGTTSSVPAVITEPTEEATVEIQTSRETPPVAGPMTPHEQMLDESSQPPPSYAESPGAYPQAYQQPPQPEKEIIVPESSSDMEEDEGVDKLLMTPEEKQQYADRVKRSYRRKTQSPKRHIHPEMPILDERYAASLLEYYSKHKPYYPGEMDGTRHAELEAAAVARSDTAMEDKSLGSSQEMISGRSSVSGGQYNGPEGEGATEDEVAAIVQSVVSAHMDEVLAARQHKQQLHEPGEVYEPPKQQDYVEPKPAKKAKAPKIAQKEKTPEQLHLTQQRFVKKVAQTYPGVTVIDESTLLCKCGVKVKLGRARMLHNYTNYHLKRCQNPPIPLPNVKTELSTTPPLHMSGALLAQYAAELHAAELQGLSMSDISGMPIPGQKPRDQESPRESSTFTEPPEKEKVQVIKNYPLNIPVPSSEMLLHGLAATAALGMTMTVPSGDSTTTQTAGMTSAQSVDLTSTQSVDATASSQSIYKTSSQGVDLTSSQSLYEPASQGVDLTAAQSGYETQGVDLTSSQSLDLTLPSSEATPITSTTHSLDLTTQVSGEAGEDGSQMEVTTETEVPTSSVEEGSAETPVMPTISDMRITIPANTSEVGVTEYGELPELTAMNDALSIIQSKSEAADRVEGAQSDSAVVVEIEPAEVVTESAEIVSESAEIVSESAEGTSDSADKSNVTEEVQEPAAESMETKESDEPINLADS